MGSKILIVSPANDDEFLKKR